MTQPITPAGWWVTIDYSVGDNDRDLCREPVAGFEQSLDTDEWVPLIADVAVLAKVTGRLRVTDLWHDSLPPRNHRPVEYECEYGDDDPNWCIAHGAIRPASTVIVQGTETQGLAWTQT